MKKLRDIWPVLVIVSVFLLLWVASNHITRGNTDNFPQPEVFDVTVQCDETVISGESAKLVVTVTSTAERDYTVEYEGTLLDVTMDGVPLTDKPDIRTTETLRHGQTTSYEYSLAPETDGVHTVVVTTDFNVVLSEKCKKEYHYTREVPLNVTG